MLRSSLFWIAAVWTLIWHRRSFVRQSSRTDCGVASTLTVLKMFSRKADPVEAVEAMDADRAGSSLEDMRRYLDEEHGIDAKSFAVSADSLAKIKGRAILHMRQMHYVVVLLVAKRGVLVFDPAMGPVYYPMADFTKLYSGYLLDCPKKRSRKKPAANTAPPTVVGMSPRRSFDAVGLFVLGLASRLLEVALILCLCVVLFMVLNRASFTSLLAIFSVLAICGGLLLFARYLRFNGESEWSRVLKSRFWRGLLKVFLKGSDINGFRGRFEKDVAGDLQRATSVVIPQRTRFPAFFGSVCAMPILLLLLNPLASAIYVVLFGYILISLHLEDVSVCRLSVRGAVGRYTKLTQERVMLSSATAPDMLGEVAKWSIIGLAGIGSLTFSIQTVALMFWILTAMQIVPIDFRRAALLFAAHDVKEPVSVLVGTEVPLRRQRVLGAIDLTIKRNGSVLQVTDISPLTMTLQQSDLTVREQRLILGDIVSRALGEVPDNEKLPTGPIRIFDPDREVTQSDFEYLTLVSEVSTQGNLPVPAQQKQIMALAREDPVRRALHSCAPSDFPVFWDVRGRMKISELKAGMKNTGLASAGHLTMNKLTIVEAA